MIKSIAAKANGSFNAGKKLFAILGQSLNNSMYGFNTTQFISNPLRMNRFRVSRSTNRGLKQRSVERTVKRITFSQWSNGERKYRMSLGSLCCSRSPARTNDKPIVKVVI